VKADKGSVFKRRREAIPAKTLRLVLKPSRLNVIQVALRGLRRPDVDVRRYSPAAPQNRQQWSRGITVCVGGLIVAALAQRRRSAYHALAGLTRGFPKLFATDP
jgi:hypothetical protein